jgi:hypothetical protein
MKAANIWHCSDDRRVVSLTSLNFTDEAASSGLGFELNWKRNAPSS